jgi:hypothetical protein
MNLRPRRPFSTEHRTKRQDPHSFEEEPEAAPAAPLSVTGLFSHNGIVSAGAVDSNHEVSQLLRRPDAIVRGDTSPAPDPARQTPGVEEPGVEEKSDAQSASSTGADAVHPAPQVDSAGLSQKAPLERSVHGSSRAELVSTGENGVQFKKDDVSHASSTVSNPEEGFTKLFQSLSAASGSVSSQSPDVAPGEAPRGGAAPEGEQLPPLKRKEEQLASSPLQQGLPLPAPGEFTPLFQRLDSPAPVRPKLAGGFTQLLRTLSAESQAEIPLLPAAPAPLLPQSSGGPGEFTRIISGSMLREARGRTGTPASVEAQQAQATANRVDSAPMPAMGSATPVLPPAQAVALTPQQLMSPSPQPPPPMPPLPQATPAPLPHTQVPPPAPAEGKLQKYMPLLLIANVFLMLLVVILVVFVLLHH